ncbi:MAG: FecCD family ABC transporter permease [Phycisphaerales bacterium JB040]
MGASGLSPGVRGLIFIAVALALLLVASVVSIRTGSSGLSTVRVLDALASGPPEPVPGASWLERLAFASFGSGATETTPDQRIVWSLRLPRTLVAMLAGAALAVSGVLLQGIMRNPLAAPNIVGLTSGASLAATLVLAVSGAGVHASLPAWAFVGAVLTGLVVYALSWQPGVGVTPIRLVLAGVAITAILTAVTTLVMITTGSAQAVTLWMAGSLGAVSWPDASTALPYVGVGLGLCLLLARPLDLLQLGEDSARSLGTRVGLVRFGAIALASVLAGAAVAVSGPIGFIGLIVPHVTRLLIGPRHAWVIPCSALGGAALLTMADLVARALSEQVPVGIVTALLGGPYFLLLLYRVRVLG